jgi:hypothetical protein
MLLVGFKGNHCSFFPGQLIHPSPFIHVTSNQEMSLSNYNQCLSKVPEIGFKYLKYHLIGAW